MSIQYTYKITSVDEQAKSMDVVYSAEGLKDFFIGVPMPSKGQAIEEVIEMYAPIYQWEEATREVEPVAVNATGTITPTQPVNPFEHQEESDNQLQNILAGFPVVNKQNAEKVMGLEKEFITLQPVYNKKASCVGISIKTSTDESLTAEEGSVMFRNGGAVIEAAKLLGVMVTVVTDNANIVDYLVNIQNFTSVPLANGSTFLHIPMVDIQAAYDASLLPSYAEKRSIEYPSIGDQLDALFHAGVFPEDMAAQIRAVKDKYPKA